MRSLSWLELSSLPPHTRVQFTEDVDLFPFCVVKAGEKATITDNGLNELICLLKVRPDTVELQNALDDWDGNVLLPRGGINLNPAGVEADPQWLEFSPLVLLEEEEKEIDPELEYVERLMAAAAAYREALMRADHPWGWQEIRECETDLLYAAAGVDRKVTS